MSPRWSAGWPRTWITTRSRAGLAPLRPHPGIREAYGDIVRGTWAAFSSRPPRQGGPAPQTGFDAQIARAVAAVSTLRARGVKLVFVRAPSIDPLYAVEQRDFPRQQTWDLLLERTGVRGIHFEDHPELQGHESPEWSHLSARAADDFTAALVPLVETALEPR